MTLLATTSLRSSLHCRITGLPGRPGAVTILERTLRNGFARRFFCDGLPAFLMLNSNAAHAGRTDQDLRWSSWMAAAQRGDAVAFKALLVDCVPHIRRVAKAIGIRDDRIDDVVQETLITVHRARHSFDADRSFTAWLNAIARRRAIDALRDWGRRDAREVFEPAAYENHLDESDSPEDKRFAEERRRLLRNAMAHLTPGQREAVEALGLCEQSLDETALATGKTKGALKVNFHRALRALRDRLERNG